MKKRGLLIVISGPSGTGKGTICRELLNLRPNIIFSVSATTRLARQGEMEGQNYFFVSKDEFKNMIKDNQLLEYAQVYGNYYGTPKNYVLENLSKGKDVLLEIDIEGALQVKEKFSDGVFIFILPPSLQELKRRIVGRGTESQQDIERRYGCAIEEIQQIDRYDYAIINDDIEKAIRDVESIIQAEKCKVSRIYNELKKKF